MKSWTVGVLLLASVSAADVFTDSFLVRLDGELGPEVADQVALRTGFINRGPVSHHL